jgi:hypothetical protein
MADVNPSETIGAKLVAEQLRHALDMVKVENLALRAQIEHDRQVYDLRIRNLERFSIDVEARLRTVTDGVTQFKVLAGLATGGGLLSLIALIRSLAGY